MRTNDFNTILTELNGSNLIITLNRPEKRNALNDEMITELITAFQQASDSNEFRTTTLRGAGSAFCSGADLEYLKKMRNFKYEMNLKDSQKLAELFLLIYRHPKPVIAVVEGSALGGGCGLASVCDFIIATPQARFGYPEVNIGFIAALVSVFLIRQIGERKARELILSGKIILAEEAQKIGLINEVFDEDKIEIALIELSTKLSTNSSLAMATTKSFLADFYFTDIESELKKMAALNARFRETKDFMEGISAFVEKRKPHWSQ